PVGDDPGRRQGGGDLQLLPRPLRLRRNRAGADPPPRRRHQRPPQLTSHADRCSLRSVSAGASGGAAGAQVCVRCANPVSPATSYLSESGLLCWTCFGQFQSQQQLAARSDAELQRSLTRRARRLAATHWVMLATVVIVATGPPAPDWGRPVLLLLVAA